MVYCRSVFSCWLLSCPAGVSTAVIDGSSLDSGDANDHVADQFALAREPVRRLELLVGLVGGRRAHVVPSFDHFHPARSARTVAAADVGDGDAHFDGAGEKRRSRGD